MKRFLVAVAATALMITVVPSAGATPTATGTTAVGLHNSYTQETAPWLVDVLDRNPGMIEIDVWTNFFFTNDFQVGHDPGNANNCSNATTYAGLRSGSRNQNLAGCLRNLKLWHDHNPNHAPLVVKVEMKNGFDGRAGYIDPVERCCRKRDAVRDGKRSHRERNATPVPHQDHKRQHEQQMIETEQDMLDPEVQVRCGDFSGTRRGLDNKSVFCR